MIRQRGFALVSAIFLLVIVAALAAFAIRIGMAQQSTVDLRLLQDRAQAAAQAGIEWGTYRVNPPSGAPATCVSLSPPLAFVVNGFIVTVDCKSTSHTEPQPPPGISFTTYDITATAQSQRAAYGSPDFVYRSVTVRLVR